MKPYYFLIPLSLIMFVTMIILITLAVKREKKLYNEGIETDSVVCKIESRLDGSRRRYYCYVKYLGNDNQMHEGLLNLRSNLPIGRKVRIKYLPDKYDNVAFVSQELDEKKDV